MNTQFYHALKVDKQKCYGCTHCMIACPTGAIRIHDGLATIREEWCVDCGECMKACPVDAIFVEQDDWEQILRFGFRIAIVPAVFFGQFGQEYETSSIIDALYRLGFNRVVIAEHSVDYIKEAVAGFQDASNAERPLISAFCPAVVRLIQVKFPSMVGSIITIKPPIDTTAMLMRRQVEDEGVEAETIGIFYVTPCAAKIAAVKSPVAETKSAVDGVVNMDLLYNKVLMELHAESGATGLNEPPYCSFDGLRWSLTGGEAANARGRCLAIDEIHNVMHFLERLENGEIEGVDFLELRACDQSCAGGVLLTENRFLTAESLEGIAQRVKDSSAIMPGFDRYRSFVVANIAVGEVKPRSMITLHENMETALKRMQRVRRLMCYLPGIDCGACGSPNCQSLAEDVVRNEAFLSNCVFIQRMMEKHRRLSNEHAFRIIEKTWGKDRLDKDCYKKGAKNERI